MIKISDKTTPLAFCRWLNKQNVDFLLDEPECKVVKGNKKIRRRYLNVLNSGYYTRCGLSSTNAWVYNHSGLMFKLITRHLSVTLICHIGCVYNNGKDPLRRHYLKCRMKNGCNKVHWSD